MPCRALCVPDGYELLLGRLTAHCPRGASPYLTVEGWCPSCGHRHRHSWTIDYGLEGISHRAAHCDIPNPPLRGKGYFVALDPALSDRHKRILAQFPHKR